MQFRYTEIDGVVEVTIDWHRDPRGAFGRVFCADEFGSRGLPTSLAQCSTSVNLRRGTVRGFHLQIPPHAEAKLVQCVAGRLFDVALDLRPGSRTYGMHHAVELSPDTGQMLFIPEGCAHALQTLEDATSLVYYISVPYCAEAARGVAWDDPAIGVDWPLRDPILSDRDRALPVLKDFRP